MLYWAIQFDSKKPMKSFNGVRIIGAIWNFRSHQARTAWMRKAPVGQSRVKLSSESMEVFYALRGGKRERAWESSSVVRIDVKRMKNQRVFKTKP